MDVVPRRLTVPVREAAVDSVTVFNDRAEVTRHIYLSDAVENGTYELTVEGLTCKSDENSVRVKAESGRGVMIMEVAFELNEKPTDSVIDEGSADKKRAELVELRRKHAELKAEHERVRDRSSMLRSYVAGMLTPQQDKPPATGLDLEAVEKLFAFSEKKGEEYDKQLQSLTDALAASQSAIDAIETTLKRLQAPMKKLPHTSRDVAVLFKLEAPTMDGERKPPKLMLTYMVTNASWSPSYDIRVDTNASQDGELELAYLGLVKNNSGEDWASCRITLSTAQPSKAGMPPAPPRRMLRWQPDAGFNTTERRRGSMVQSRMIRAEARNAIPMQACISSNVRLERAPSCSALEAEVLGGSDDDERLSDGGVDTTTLTAGGGGTAHFVIQRSCSIEADNKPHRVAITMLRFTPKLLYFATPTLESTFYLQVKAKNTSPFPLLASKRVSVFLDGSFITTTSLKDVSPSEEFTTFLGADAAIKIEHQVLAREHKDASGWSTKTQTTTHRFCSRIHNTKSVPVQLTVVEVLPKSTEDKIKVELQVPAIKDPNSGEVVQNKVTNNIVWSFNLDAGSKRDLPFEYAVTWPSDKSIDSYDLSQ